VLPQVAKIKIRSGIRLRERAQKGWQVKAAAAEEFQKSAGRMFPRRRAARLPTAPGAALRRGEGRFAEEGVPVFAHAAGRAADERPQAAAGTVPGAAERKAVPGKGFLLAEPFGQAGEFLFGDALAQHEEFIPAHTVDRVAAERIVQLLVGVEQELVPGVV